MSKKRFLPEGSYSLDSKMSLEKIVRAKEKNNFLVCKVVSVDLKNSLVKVDLGNGFEGKIPLDEFTIYPEKDSLNQVTPSVISLVGRNICACVKEIVPNCYIRLSRKENMQKAVKFFSSKIGDTVDCQITSVISFGVFVDVGSGINGFIKLKNLTRTKIEDATILGFKKGQIIKVKILSINDDCKINLSYKELFDDLSQSLSPGDYVSCIVLNKIEGTDTYFAYLNPNSLAILNCPLNLSYGTKVTAWVRDYNPKRPNDIRLKFYSC